MQTETNPSNPTNPPAPTGSPGAVAVLLTLPLKGALDYRMPVGTATLEPGTFVRVPLSGRSVTGVVWGPAEGNWPLEKLKEIEAVLNDIPALSPDCLDTVRFTASYTLSPPGAVLRMVLSCPDALAPAPTRRVVRPATDPAPDVRVTPAREKVLAAARVDEAVPIAVLAERAGVSDGVVRGLAKAGTLMLEEESADPPFVSPDPERAGPALRPEQALAANTLCAALGTFQAFLLDGVTGSGKTEVYFEVISEALRRDSQAQILVLVPEIGLTSQWLDRFEDRFGVPPVAWHSDIGSAARRRVWRQVSHGGARVVVGARSALFLPFGNLAAIIVDEEHDPSFKQEDGVMYHARDMAVVRARAAACPVILASATPSLETRINAKAGRYQLLQLSERHGDAVLPRVCALDLRKAPPAAGRWISPPLEEAIAARLSAGEQVMLFLNRRGYAPLTLCRTCGHRFGCPDCSTWLVEHRFRRTLVCHQCGHSEAAPDACPTCHAPDSLVACGPGVERLFEEVSALFPEAKVVVMTSDTLTRPAETARLVRMVADGAVDLVIGTQLVTKGYHFPNLTLVGVIDADLGLRGGDLRAAERTYQQLTQVAGRAGRAEKPGEVMLQTYEPSHPVVDALVRGDDARFLALEEEARHQHAMPPFGNLVAVILSGEDEMAVMAFGRKLAQTAPAADGVEVLGPAPAPITRIRGQFRARLLMHAVKTVRVQPLVRSWLARAGKSGSVRVKVDIDPYSFL